MTDKKQPEEQQTTEPTVAKITPEPTKDLTLLRPGVTVRISQKIKEGEKERVQTFEGLVIALHGGKGVNGTVTVRKVSLGIAVERIFPLHLPTITAIRVVKRAHVRRAKLHYVRNVGARKLKETMVK